MVPVKRIFRKNQIMITALAIMIAVAGYLNFAGEQIGEEDFLVQDGSETALTYEMTDISDEDMYAIAMTDEAEGQFTDYTDLASLDADYIGDAENYLAENMEIIGDSDEDTLAMEVNADAEAASEEDVVLEEVPGEAVFTSATGVTSLAGAKLLKEQTRAQNKEALLEIIDNASLTEEAKQEAVDSMIAMTETAQRETDAEMLLEAKGYTETVVSISDGTADVMIGAVSLTDTQTAQIIDIVQRKTEVAPENIIITVSGSN
ncbi:MAG: SpoIIIAH-like family protein [Lachnospiraceae bacterium]|nr:SpoIIIAH-like family protein [Lachnospiraceae bacterium]